MPKNSKKGFSLVEILVAMTIFALMVGGIYAALHASNDAWTTAQVESRLRDNLRVTLERISRELRESGSANGTMQVTLRDGEGSNGSDILRFSMPVVCEAGGSVIDANGDVAHWGAPLRWGCNDSTCMDADNNCATVDYRYVEYEINENNDMLRRVLDNGARLVQEDIFARNIADLQTTLSADQNVVTLTVTATRNSDLRRLTSLSRSLNVYLRNRS